MVLAGKTGFGAAEAHSPIGEDGRERYVFFATPHVAVGQAGAVGEVARQGRQQPSSGCGALISVLTDILEDRLDSSFDPDDIEQSLLRAKISDRLQTGEQHDLLSITNLAHDVILDDLERTLDATFDPQTADLAVVTGIQIHAPGAINYIQPRTAYVVVQGERRTLDLTDMP